MSERMVTVFVTVYNIETYLERFFECLNAQTFTDYEVLIIDDGSTDGSLAICQRHAREDDRIRILSVDHIGISAARNLAFENIRTPYAASLDGDDYFDKDYLKHLTDAVRTYQSDLVLSNVIYITETGKEKERFVFRPQSCYTRDDFPSLLPALLEENRLNFLYAKLYRTALLKNVRVESNVMQGSDTMINIMYLENVRSIAIIEDYDYYYVQYSSRSVTSYSGTDFSDRLFRINLFLRDKAKAYGFLNEEMQDVIDRRILFSGRASLTKIGMSQTSMKKSYRLASNIVNNEEYTAAYHRQKNAGKLDAYRKRYCHDAIAPGAEKDYVDYVRAIQKQKKKAARLGRWREICPDTLFNIWHNTKVKLGIARKE